MCQALGKGFLDTTSVSPYSNPTERRPIISPLSMRGKCEALEIAQGGTGGREQDWDGNPDLKLQNPGSYSL